MESQITKQLLSPDNPAMKRWSEIQHDTGMKMGSFAMAAESDLEYRVTHDSLTGLLNRDGLKEWFEQNKPETFMIVMLDGRGFGKINKKHGHSAGDNVLRHVASQLSGKFRTEEGIPEAENRKNPEARDKVAVSRWGGDEFVMVVDFSELSQAEIEQARMAVDRKLDNFGNYDHPDGQQIDVSLRHASVIGRASDKLPFDHYYSVADDRLQQITQAEKP